VILALFCATIRPVTRSPHRSSGRAKTAQSATPAFQYDLLDLRGVDILAAGDDHIFLAAADGQIALVVEAAEVAGMDPAVTKSLGRLSAFSKYAVTAFGERPMISPS